MAGTTSRGFRYPTSADLPNVHLDVKNLADDVNDQYLAVATVGALPAAGKPGRHAIVTAAPARLMVDDGTAWVNASVPALPRASLKRTTDQPITNLVDTAIAFTAEDYDVGTLHDNVTLNSRIVLPVDGVWTFFAQVQWAQNVAPNGSRQISIRSGGFDWAVNRRAFNSLIDDIPVAASRRQAVAFHRFFAAGTILEVFVSHSQGAALNAESAGTFFNAAMIGL